VYADWFESPPLDGMEQLTATQAVDGMNQVFRVQYPNACGDKSGPKHRFPPPDRCPKLGKSEGAVRVLLSRALTRLAAVMVAGEES